MKKDDLLIKKWELLWNHYKLQNECMEKRRNFFWIVESALLVAFYSIINEIDNFMVKLIIPLAIFTSIAWLIVSIRQRVSIKLTEDQIIETEKEWNKMCDINLDKFIRDEDYFKCQFLWSQLLWMDYATPVAFLIAWMLLVKKYLYILTVAKDLILGVSFVG